MAVFRQYDVRCDGQHYLHVVEAGSGPAVVFLHGGAGSWTNFSRQLDVMANEFRVIALDLRGHGSSPWHGDSTVDDFYSDVDTVLKQLDLHHEFHVIGHSFGGYLAARLACTYRQRVASLALLNTCGDLPRGVAYRFLETCSGAADFFHERYPWLVNTRSEVASCLMRHTFRDWNCWDLFPQIVAKTLVILGAFDPLVPLTRGVQMAKSIPNAILKVLPTGGHVCLVDKPKIVTELLTNNISSAVRNKCLVRSA